MFHVAPVAPFMLGLMFDRSGKCARGPSNRVAPRFGGTLVHLAPVSDRQARDTDKGTKTHALFVTPLRETDARACETNVRDGAWEDVRTHAHERQAA